MTLSKEETIQRILDEQPPYTTPMKLMSEAYDAALSQSAAKIAELEKELARQKARVCIGGDVFETNRNEHILHLSTELDYLKRAEAAESRERVLREALRKIADHGGCECDHTTEDCCANCDPFDFVCPECIAGTVLLGEGER